MIAVVVVVTVVVSVVVLVVVVVSAVVQAAACLPSQMMGPPRPHRLQFYVASLILAAVLLPISVQQG